MKNVWQLLQMKNWKKNAFAMVWIMAMSAVFLLGCGGERNNAETTKTQMTTTAAEVDKLPISAIEKKLLSELYGNLAEGDLSGAANILNENKKVFETLLSETLEGEKYGYYETVDKKGKVKQHMGLLNGFPDFYGMVLTRNNTVFYGAFLNGAPEGKCTAIQTMVLDHPRYSYATGVWADGKMNGEGQTGYHYYLDAPESGLIRTQKTGNYRSNLLDGTFQYETENSDGETLTWEIKAVNGVTVITPEWEYYPYRKEYMLGSKEDSARAYVLSKDKSAVVMWNNLILWN